jgi:hypothetical protein
MSNAERTISEHQGSISNTNLTVGKALLQNQWAGGPGGSGRPFLLDIASEEFLYSMASTPMAATTPPAWLTFMLLSGANIGKEWKFNVILNID